MTWLEERAPDVLKRWIRHTSIPLLVTKLDGGILWTNQSFELLVGYTWSELEGLPGGWRTLTANPKDVNNDSDMAKAVVAGEREDYRIRKEYLHKSGELKHVEIHVLRYPVDGDFEFFLVSVVPLDLAFSSVIDEISGMKLMMASLVEKPDAFDKLSKLVNAYPKTSMIVIGALLYLIFGERVFELYKMFTL